MRLACAELRENETWLRPKGTVLRWLAAWLNWLVVSQCIYTPHADKRPRRSRYDTYSSKGRNHGNACHDEIQNPYSRPPANARLCYQTPWFVSRSMNSSPYQ